MQRSKTQATKQLNSLGTAYRDSKLSRKLSYRAALLDAGENDKTDYWRAFRENWQYSLKMGRAPFMILELAKEHLQISIDTSK